MREDYNIVIVTFAGRSPVGDLGIFFGPEGDLSSLPAAILSRTQREPPGWVRPSGSGLGFQVAVNNTEAGERERQEWG